ncbi:NAD(P)H-dependent oxidoreductase [Acidipropionibacterium timonense]|uniref:NAD(P)H-dependent oxidoreductase n=1 Tax=Acidipropionibacterium timonense TaxID=2161818 RepID=UPI001031D834|nr:NAD(P)H-dependent oxidoreductase [Acidipropionibacterium timonense]
MILVVQGHPDASSFCAALAGAYVDGIGTAAVAEVIDLSRADFDPVLRMGYRERMPEDPFVERSIRLVQEVAHLTLVLPVWWAAEPSILKGWFDRVLVPGIAYHYRPGRPAPDRLLTGRTATLVATSHAPAWYARMRRSYPVTRLRKDVLGYCGVRVTSTLLLGGMDGPRDTEASRRAFLERVRARGAADAARR